MNFIAIDLGASSGRVINFKYHNQRLELQIKHRFINEYIKHNDNYFWDIEKICNEILIGLKKCHDITSIGVDGWGVDYVCLKDNKINNVYSYRDPRTLNFNSKFDQKQLFELTGVGYLNFNTIYQLEVSEKLDGNFMMIPDYINYFLTNTISNEIVNSITTQLINTNSLDFDKDIINNLKQDKLIFNKPTSFQKWKVSNDIEKKIGYSTNVVQIASHDSACAFLGSLNCKENIVISLGTWSIIGCINDKAIVSQEAYDLGFSNEGSIDKQFRVQKNSMGTWMFEQLRKTLNDHSDYEDILREIDCSNYNEIIDVDDDCFINPLNMKDEIDNYLDKNMIKKPSNNIEYYKLIFDSMIYKYELIINQLIKITNREFKEINIVGGASQNTYICKKVSLKLNMVVNAGPIEATSYGNVACQLLANNIISDYSEYNEILKRSVEIKRYEV